jgi:hypothetical protein
MTEVILQILITLRIGILNRLSQIFTHIASDSYFYREKKFWCQRESFVRTLKKKKIEEPDGVFFAGL